ncbi:tetratricopeptide repeat protein [Sphingobium sp. WCS2017Hpa-17]|uniref:tetratricopeptide repeat protein n=1 Tax=Sphingobium sp. WCS2017Hpa-17 TaxID=3073638 RepID=UPI00288B3586|nr:tetratricopeptide repeat protein [Sphingobium sp. WCS2017Hpa-17]
MRLTVLLPLCCAVAAPAQAQNVHGISGIHFGITSSPAGPITGYAPTEFSSAFARNTDIGRAQNLIAAGQYAEADRLLTTLVGRTSSKQVRFLKGAAKLGMGDAEAARRYFEQSLYQGRNGYPGAMSGLAIAEIRLGNRDAAQNILDKLRSQQDKCGISCDRAKSLNQAIGVVEKALI